MTSFMHVFNTNKVPRVVLVFLLEGTHLGKNEVTEPHQAGATEPACAIGPAGEAGPVGAVGSAGVAGPAPYHDPSSGDYHFHKHTLYE
jgi:hypothetical protein